MRKWGVAILALALLLVGTLLPLVVPRHCPVNRAAFERVKEGMTQAEVEEILGGPPGDYRTRPHGTNIYLSRMFSGLDPIIEDWEGDEGSVAVEYEPGADGRERVTKTHFEEAAPYSPGLLELALWRLGKLLP
jgi:hypothetical protein